MNVDVVCDTVLKLSVCVLVIALEVKLLVWWLHRSVDKMLRELFQKL